MCVGGGGGGGGGGVGGVQNEEVLLYVWVRSLFAHLFEWCFHPIVLIAIKHSPVLPQLLTHEQHVHQTIQREGNNYSAVGPSILAYTASQGNSQCMSLCYHEWNHILWHITLS